MTVLNENPNRPEANATTIYKRGRVFELGATVKIIQIVFRIRLEPEKLDRESEVLTTR